MLLKMFNANRLTDNIPSLQLKKMRTFPIRKKKILIFYFLHSDKQLIEKADVIRSYS